MINQLLPYRNKMLVISIGIVYLWFGMLKFFPGVSPAEELAKATLTKLSFGLVSIHITYFMLALWEVTIGVFLLLNLYRKFITYSALLHMFFTFTPLFLLPELSFHGKLHSLTLVGQYIIKNLILFSALLCIYPERQRVITT